MMTLPLGLDLAMVIGASLGLVRTEGSIVTVHLVARGAFLRSLGSPGSACTAGRWHRSCSAGPWLDMILQHFYDRAASTLTDVVHDDRARVGGSAW